MSKLRASILTVLQSLGDNSGCHQMPERSFHIGTYTFPVCARCTGVVAGEVLAVFTIFIGLKVRFVSAALFILLMGADWFVQFIGVRESTNTRRFFTGICGGFGLTHIYFFILVSAFQWIMLQLF